MLDLGCHGASVGLSWQDHGPSPEQLLAGQANLEESPLYLKRKLNSELFSIKGDSVTDNLKCMFSSLSTFNLKLGDRRSVR